MGYLARGKHWNSLVSSLSSVTRPAIPPSIALLVKCAKWGFLCSPRQTGAHQAFRLIALLHRNITRDNPIPGQNVCNVNQQAAHRFSHKAGSTKIPVQPRSISKKRVFESVTRSSAPASMKNPSLSSDLKTTSSRKTSCPPWLKLGQNQCYPI